MAYRIRKASAMIAAVALLAAAAGAADLKSLAKALYAVPSTTGNEDMLAAKVRGALPKGLAVEADGLGTIAVRLNGAGGPTLVLAALDGYGHMVSGITPEGYLTLDRPVPPPHARFDAFLLGQPVVVSTAKGPVAGVVSQPALHLLTPERRKLLVEGFSLETAYVDIAVRSEAEARARGVEILDAVTYPAVLTELAGGAWAGPELGLKSVAAVLVALTEDLAGPGTEEETVLAWAAQTKFLARGRGARPAVGAVRANARWRPRRTVVVGLVAAGEGPGRPQAGAGPVLVQAKDEATPLQSALEKAAGAAGRPLQHLVAEDSPLALPFAAAPGEVVTLALPVRFLHTPSEVVALADLEALREILLRSLRKGGAA
ncbi:MAG: M42 family metallopeptidase [Acidobacteria bacterium]|nr:M42 family metallopeptidase [Acidobacteriota bacterium]